MHFFEQLYDKGVDIWADVFANLISAVILGVVARLFWRHLLPPDLMAQVLIDRTTRLDEEWERYDQLAETLSSYVARAEKADDFGPMRVVWTEYIDWLKQHSLTSANAVHVHQRTYLAGAVQGGHPDNIPNTKKMLLQTLKETQIPEPRKPRPSV